MSILDNRASGVLMHISSLPGNTGIGTLGKYAYQFVDYLKKYGQTYWQMLPICPTSYGDSPYQSFSTFAGNPYFIDFEKLEAEGLLAHDDWANVNWGNNKNYVDYGLLYVERHKVFCKASGKTSIKISLLILKNTAQTILSGLRITHFLWQLKMPIMEQAFLPGKAILKYASREPL